jgi:hypothetical protein
MGQNGTGWDFFEGPQSRLRGKNKTRRDIFAGHQSHPGDASPKRHGGPCMQKSRRIVFLRGPVPVVPCPWSVGRGSTELAIRPSSSKSEVFADGKDRPSAVDSQVAYRGGFSCRRRLCPLTVSKAESGDRAPSYNSSVCQPAVRKPRSRAPAFNNGRRAGFQRGSHSGVARVEPVRAMPPDPGLELCVLAGCS